MHIHMCSNEARNDLWENRSHSLFVLEKYFCTGKNIFVLGKIFLYWEKYFCTGINIFVLGKIFLYWDKYFCTGINIFVLG